jgi:hypothetical protein
MKVKFNVIKSVHKIFFFHAGPVCRQAGLIRHPEGVEDSVFRLKGPPTGRLPE